MVNPNSKWIQCYGVSLPEPFGLITLLLVGIGKGSRNNHLLTLDSD